MTAAAAADAGTPTVVAADDHAAAAVDDGDVIMGDAQSDNDNAPPSSTADVNHAMDAALGYYLDNYPSLLLLPNNRPSKTNGGGGSNNNNNSSSTTAKAASANKVVHSETKVHSPPNSSSSSSSNNNIDNNAPPPSTTAITNLTSILTFQTALLKNATSKSLYNSLPHLNLLLASSCDSLASLAIEVLASLASPLMLHRQQAPEMQQHTTKLHGSGMGGSGSGSGASDASVVMWRLMQCARGWGEGERGGAVEVRGNGRCCAGGGVRFR